MQKYLTKNIIAGAVYLIFGLFVVFILIPIGINDPSNVQYPPLAPSYWPRIIGLCLAALGLAMLVRSGLQTAKEPTPDVGKDAPAHDRALWRAAVVIGLGFALYAVLEPLGFVLATSIALVILMLFAGERRVQIILPVALGIPLALYFFFTKAASIPIPSGILESILVGG